MERVKKGEKYWILLMDKFGIYPLKQTETRHQDNALYFAQGNYFNTEEEAEVMAEKIRKVLNGADVIEMPSEEDVYNEEFKTNPYFFGEDGAAVVGAHQGGFKHCFEWLKSKIVK